MLVGYILIYYSYEGVKANGYDDYGNPLYYFWSKGGINGHKGTNTRG